MALNCLKNKTILVTGGAGFVGSHLVEELIKNKAKVVVIDNFFSPGSYFFSQKLNQKVITIEGDVSNFRLLLKLVRRYQIDYIFHLAAQPLVETAYLHPKTTLEINILGTINVLECTRLCPNIKGVIIASSDKAYGKLGKKKYREVDFLRGDHPYEVSKATADLISNSYYKTYHLPIVVTRFGNIYGEGDLNFSRLIPGIMKSIIKGKVLPIRSDGSYIRDYLYVKDVVRGYLLLLKNINKVKGEAFNFGSHDTYSVLELVRLIGKSLKREINYKVLSKAKNEIPYQSLNFIKIKKTLGWQPKYSLKKTIKKINAWYQKNL